MEGRKEESRGGRERGREVEEREGGRGEKVRNVRGEKERKGVEREREGGEGKAKRGWGETEREGMEGSGGNGGEGREEREGKDNSWFLGDRRPV